MCSDGTGGLKIEGGGMRVGMGGTYVCRLKHN